MHVSSGGPGKSFIDEILKHQLNGGSAIGGLPESMNGEIAQLCCRMKIGPDSYQTCNIAGMICRKFDVIRRRINLLEVLGAVAFGVDLSWFGRRSSPAGREERHK